MSAKKPRKLCHCGSTDRITLQMTMRGDGEYRAYEPVCMPCAAKMVADWNANLAKDLPN